MECRSKSSQNTGIAMLAAFCISDTLSAGLEKQLSQSSYLLYLKNCSKPSLSNGEEVSLFALAVLPGVSHVKCWAGHHQRGTGTHFLQHIIESSGSSYEFREFNIFVFLQSMYYLEVNFTVGHRSITCSALCFVGNTLL